MTNPSTLGYTPDHYASHDGVLYDLSDPDEFDAYREACMLEALGIAVSAGLIVVCGCELF